MVTLTRLVPIRLSAPPAVGAAPAVSAVAGQPGGFGLGIPLELEIRVSGEPDPQSGYLVSISDIDSAVRAALPNALVGADPAKLQGEDGGVELLRALAKALAPRLAPRISLLALRTGSYARVQLEDPMDTALLTKRFDFCAAHRLHLPELSDAENAARFGKCSHPSGHGHNYRLEVTVRAPVGAAAPLPAEWETIVAREVVDRYDHRNLNVDCPEFASLNPSVEHIARTCFERLEGPLARAGVTLRRVCVWESEKTWCSVPD